MFLRDKLTLDEGVRLDAEGALLASVRCARTGCQDYAGYEVGKPDMARVTVYRPEESVFSRDSFKSFASTPVTLQHPPVSVTTDNWKDFAVGNVGEDIVRDGEFVRVPMMVRDAAAIKAVQGGTNEISMGYSCELEFVDGVAPDGTAYQAIQKDIKINHLAIVDRARGGSHLKIGDDMSTVTIQHDGLSFEVNDSAKQLIEKLQGELGDAKTSLTDAQTEVGTLTADKAKLTKDLEDAKNVDVEALAAERTACIDAAKKVSPKMAFDGKSLPDIKREVVAAALGDAATDMADATIDGAFIAVTKDAKTPDAVADTLSTGEVVAVGDSQAVRDTARANYIKRLNGKDA